jgi:predicted DsbA family dithiol-disulfide isomerase
VSSSKVEVSPGTMVVWADIGCPWAHHAVWRWHETRSRLGLESRVHLDVRAFPLEVFNGRPTPKRILDAEMPVVCALDPRAGWQVWQAHVYEWPVTTLPALEAVEAAKEQGLAASEQMDRALRVAFFGESKCISIRSVILDVAAECGDVDEDKLAEALDDGRARRAVMDQKAFAETAEVKGSPHFFLPDGSDLHNPGVKHHWERDQGAGFPVIDSFDPSVYDELLQRAVE